MASTTITYTTAGPYTTSTYTREDPRYYHQVQYPAATIPDDYLKQLQAAGLKLPPELAAGSRKPPGAPGPLVGRPEPKPIKELMKMPERVTDAHLALAMRVLNGAGSIRALMSRRQRSPLRERLFRNKPRWQLLYDDYVRLAVEKQWQMFAPGRFLKLCKVLDKSKRGNTLVVREHLVLNYYGKNKDTVRRDYYVAYRCPSSGKRYVSGVPESTIELVSSTPPYARIGEYSADKAMAWKFGLRLREYQQLKVEA